jgi:hypothetical protein
MIPVDIDDILGGLAAAQSLHRSGFTKANNTSQSRDQPEAHAF